MKKLKTLLLLAAFLVPVMTAGVGCESNDDDVVEDIVED